MKTNTIISRDEFREGTFKRDGFKCVICGSHAKDAHHIIERRLFADGGYYLGNGASLCEQHHIEAEQTTLTCDEIRLKAGIENVIIPEHFYADYNYGELPSTLKGRGFGNGAKFTRLSP